MESNHFTVKVCNGLCSCGSLVKDHICSLCLEWMLCSHEEHVLRGEVLTPVKCLRPLRSALVGNGPVILATSLILLTRLVTLHLFF